MYFQPCSDLHVPVQRDLVGACDAGGGADVAVRGCHLCRHQVAILGLSVAKERQLYTVRKVWADFAVFDGAIANLHVT